MLFNLKQWFVSRFDMSAKRRCMAACSVAVLAGGLSFVGQTSAIEAIQNGSFEESSPLGWTGGFGTYNHGTQVYYEGPAPAGSGAVYGWNPGLGEPRIATQVLNLSAGIGDIDGGVASYDFSAWLSSWTSDTDYAVLELEWNDSTSGNGSVVGTPVVFDGSDEFGQFIVGSADANGDPDATVAWTQDNWTLHRGTGLIPTGTRSAVVRYQGMSESNNGNDAYLDLVSLDLSFDVSSPTLDLLVDRDARTLQIQNNTGIAQTIVGYSVLSQAGALVRRRRHFPGGQ